MQRSPSLSLNAWPPSNNWPRVEPFSFSKRKCFPRWKHLSNKDSKDSRRKLPSAELALLRRGGGGRRAPRCHTDSDILARYPSQDLVHPFARRKSARGIAAPLTTDRNVSPVLETSTARRRWENERSIPFLLLLVPPSSYS